MILRYQTKIFLIFVFVFTLSSGTFVYAQPSVDELKSKISDKNDEVKSLETEISRLDKNVRETESTKGALKIELRQIDAAKNKLTKDIKITLKKIDTTNIVISRLEKEIEDKRTKIMVGTVTISNSLRLTNEMDLSSLPEKILSGMSLSKFWAQVSYLVGFQSKISDHIKELETTKKDLESDKKKLEQEKNRSISLKNQLSDQQKIASQNIIYKNKLIKETSNKEAVYKKLLAETEAKKRAVEDELISYESELRIVLDPTSLPTAGKKILSWPLDSVAITQYFGNTAFAMSHSIYNGRGHSGIDLRAAIGTPIKAALSGIVVGTGDTDSVCYRASYGKWIMVNHRNGLSTIYGHLSLIKVATGEEVNTADIIGYTGRSGYATGPHLHFTVAATEAVKVGNLKSKVKECGTYTIPLGPFNGYLNPLLYL